MFCFTPNININIKKKIIQKNRKKKQVCPERFDSKIAEIAECEGVFTYGKAQENHYCVNASKHKFSHIIAPWGNLPVSADQKRRGLWMLSFQSETPSD